MLFDPKLYTSADAVPASAASILEQALRDQDEIFVAVNDRELARRKELDTLAARPHQMADQQQRRLRVMEANEEAAVANLTQCVETVRQALRDTPSTLRPDGAQTYTFGNRDVYEGEWHNANLQGRGRWTSVDGGVEYEGDWFLGQRSGNGTFRCSLSNSTYVGRWYDNRRHGKGELTEREGSYRGEFRDNRFSGVGTYVYGDGHRYVGDWQNDRFHGQGTYTTPGGLRLEGEWVAGLLSGKATVQYDREGREVYHGEFALGKRHGRGQQLCKDHLKYTGDWAHDEWNGHGHCVWASGDVYEGEFVRGRRHGAGNLKQADHASYSGEWRDGRRHGRGVYRASHGRSSFDGQWRNDRKHGPGVLTLELAGSLTGTWIDDMLHGTAKFQPTFGEEITARYEHGQCMSAQEKAVVVKVALSLGSRDDALSRSPLERDDLFGPSRRESTALTAVPPTGAPRGRLSRDESEGRQSFSRVSESDHHSEPASTTDRRTLSTVGWDPAV